MSIYEYDEELHFRTLREEGRADGLAKGLEQGENRVNQLYSILIDTGRIDDLKRAVKDKLYQKQLMSELLPIEMQNI